MANNKKTGGRRKVYRMGRHFRVYHKLTYVAISMVVIGFFFIYNFLFVGEGSFLTTEMLAAGFIPLEVLLMWLVKKGGAWIKEIYYYELDDRGVTVVLKDKRTTYTWDKFQEVSMGMHSFIDLCPVQYVYDGKKLEFSQYLEDMWGMHLLILDYIEDHVEIPDGLRTQLTAFSAE